MRVAGLIARYLLGLIFLIFGANGFLHFIPMAQPTGVAGQFLGALFVSHVLVVIFLLELLPAILLLVGRYVPLALVLTLLELFLIWAYRLSFRGLFDAAPEIS